MEKFWTTRYLKSGTIIFSVIFLCLLYKEISIFPLKHLDSVMYVEALANTVEKGQPVTTSNKTFRDAASMFTWSSEKICTEDTFVFEGTERNVLDNHAYYMNFPISIFANFLDAEIVAATVHVLQFVLFAFIVYLYLVRRGVSIGASLLFAFVVMAHPNWSLAVQGQYYFDRLYLPIGLLLCIFVYDLIDKAFSFRKLLTVVIIAVIASAIQERAALITAISLSLFAVLFFHSLNKKYSISLFALSLLIVCYTVFIMTTFEADSFSSNAGEYKRAIQMFFKPYFIEDPSKLNLVYTFFAVNLFLGIWGIFSKRLLLLAFIIMLPNILIWTPGPASKTGWLTHYHSYYFPFVVFAGMHGFMVLRNRINNKYATNSALVITFLLLIFLNPYQGNLGFKNSPKNNTLVASVLFMTDKKGSSERVFIDYKYRLAELIPAGSVVSTRDGFFSALYKKRNVLHFPVGINKADYIVLPNRGEADETPRFRTAINYNGKEAQLTIDRCMEQKLIDNGFNVEEPIKIGYFSILKKTTE